MMKSRVETPASASVRIAPKRRSGRGARGSSRRASAASAVVIERFTTADAAQELGVTGDEARLRRDRETKPRHLSRGFENTAGHLEASLGGLIRIGRGTEGDGLSALPRLPELADEPAPVDLLHVDRSLERVGIGEPEKFVRVPSEAVMAAHLAATIRIDRPAKRHGARVQLAYEALGSKLVIFNAAALIDRGPEPQRHSRRRNSWGGVPSRHLLTLLYRRKTRGSVRIPGLLYLASGLLTPPASASSPACAGTTVDAARTAGPGALRLRASLVDHEIPIPEQPAVEHLDRLAGLFLRCHLDEPESARPSRELVRDDADRLHGSRLLEELAKVLLGGLEREVSYEQLCGHRTTS